MLRRITGQPSEEFTKLIRTKLALTTAAGSVVYAVTFVGVAIGRDERQAYLMKAREIVKRRKPSRTVAGAIQRTA